MATRYGTTRPSQVGMYSGEVPEPESGSGIAADDSGKPEQQKQGLGFWLDASEEDVAKDIDQQWRAQDKSFKNRVARWDLNERRLEGDTYSKLVHDTDQDTFRIYTPENAELAPPSLNKTRDLCNKVVANLLVDPPKFEAEPSSDEDEDVSAAEFTTRALENEIGEAGLDLIGKLEEAEDLACSQSAFLRFYVDPHGGGRRPKEIYASQAALTVDDALFAEAPAPGPDMATVDQAQLSSPESVGIEGIAPDAPVLPPDGLPPVDAGVDVAAGAEAPPPLPLAPPGKVPQPGPYFIRYVKVDGTLTDDASEADIEWLPKIRCEVLSGRNCRFLPETASGIDDAQGVLIAAYTTMGDIRRRFPDALAKYSPAEQQKFVDYNPPDTKKLLPKSAGDGQGTKKPGQPEGPPDDAQVLTITGYIDAKKAGPSYPKGAYVCMAGGKCILERMPWETMVQLTENKSKYPLPKDIPVAQVRQFKHKDDGHGRGMVDLIGDGDPIRAFLLGSVIEYLHRVNNPHIFLPIGAVHENYVALPRGVPIPYNPSAGGPPTQEQFAPLPSEFMELYDTIGALQDSMSGLQEAAQGTSDANSQSGIAKQIVVEQALVALGKPKRALDRAGIRSCRIILQLMRDAYTTPQKVRIVGEDGAFKEQEFTASDLGSTLDVRIMPGTSTMLPASAKQDLILRYATPIDPNQPPILTMVEAKKLIRTGVRAVIGMQDAPALQRVKGQIKQWKDGPPENWQPVPPQLDPATGQPPIDPMTGAPLPPPPDPANPFADQRPTDDEPEGSQIRFQELSDLVSSGAFRKWGDQWGQFALDEYLRAKTSAGVMTIPEQQMMAQQQADAAAAAEQDGQAKDRDAQAQEGAAQRQAQSEEGSAQRAHEQDLAAMKEAGAVQREAAKQNAKS